MPAYAGASPLWGTPILPEGSRPGQARMVTGLALLIRASAVEPMEE